MEPNASDMEISRLGECRIASPMNTTDFVDDDKRVLFHSTLNEAKAAIETGGTLPSFEMAGPRRKNLFRSLEAQVRDRYMRWDLPGVERCDPRHRVEPSPSLRRSIGIRVSVWIRRPFPGIPASACRSGSRKDRRYPLEGGGLSWVHHGGLRTSRKWWIPSSG